MNARMQSIHAEFLSAVASQAVASLRANLENGMGDGEPLAPLNIWDGLKFYSEEGHELSADRSNSDMPLHDTGRLKQSVAVSKVTAQRTQINGRNAIEYTIEIVAEPYGNQHASGATFRNVFLGRTKSIRKSGSFGSLLEGVDYVVRENLTVPSRPWNRISRLELQRIAEGAMRSAIGA